MNASTTLLSSLVRLCRRLLIHVLTIKQVSFLAIIPLERLFDYCGEQMAFYCGKDLGDLIVITLNKYVTLLLVHCCSASTANS